MRAGRPLWACTLCLALLLLPCTGSGAATPPSKLVEWPLHIAAEARAAAGGKVSGQAAAVNAPEEKAGYVSTDGSRKIFYYYFGARNASGQAVAGAPLLVWMNGGPGCSSLFGLFFENGPYTINLKGLPVSNPHTWALAANMLYIDQPINTGLSYSTKDWDMATSQSDVANTMVTFMRAFYLANPALAKVPLFLSGESFAGHYLPAIAVTMQMSASFPLAGVAMGNPCVSSPAVQDSYFSFGAAHGLLTSAFLKNAAPAVRKCKQLSAVCMALGNADMCSSAAGFCSGNILEPMLVQPNMTGRNYYNIAKPCEQRDDCYATQSRLLDAYVNAQKGKWGTPASWAFKGCSDAAYYALQSDLERSYDLLVPPLLEEGIPVLVYSGRLDFLCNWHGNQAWVDSLLWSRAAEWRAAATGRYRAGSVSNAGTVKQLGPLSLISIHNAGHMVPMDAPRVSLEMIRSFVSKTPFLRENGTVTVMRDGKLVQA